MPNETMIIRSIGLLEDGVLLEYVDYQKDLRDSGLVLNHTIFIPAGDDYDDEIEAVVLAVRALLADALQDFANVPPTDLEALAAQAEAEETDDDD